MKHIKKAIEFAIENGYKLPFQDLIEWDIQEDGEINLVYADRVGGIMYQAIITSEDFIEAIARGIYKNNEWKMLDTGGAWMQNIHIGKNVYEYFDSEEEFEKLQEDICTQQSLAIANNELESFYFNLLKNRIKTLKNSDIGKKVVYIDNFGSEIGVIKSFCNDIKTAWVVYKCNNDWDNFKNYTGQSTSYEDLEFIY